MYVLQLQFYDLGYILLFSIYFQFNIFQILLIHSFFVKSAYMYYHLLFIIPIKV